MEKYKTVGLKPSHKVPSGGGPIHARVPIHAHP